MKRLKYSTVRWSLQCPEAERMRIRFTCWSVVVFSCTSCRIIQVSWLTFVYKTGRLTPVWSSPRHDVANKRQSSPVHAVSSVSRVPDEFCPLVSNCCYIRVTLFTLTTDIFTSRSFSKRIRGVEIKFHAFYTSTADEVERSASCSGHLTSQHPLYSGLVGLVWILMTEKRSYRSRTSRTPALEPVANHLSGWDVLVSMTTIRSPTYVGPVYLGMLFYWVFVSMKPLGFIIFILWMN
jgi:hypothetical protein